MRGILLGLALLALPAPTLADFAFQLHDIGAPGGSKFGQTSLADVDGDGDLDFISGQRNGLVFWHEFMAPDRWLTHRIGAGASTDVGGCAFDVDGDGNVDQVSGAVWYRHPGRKRVKTPWQRFDNGAIPCHDNFAADIDGDGRLDLVAMSDQRGLFWYKVPADPTTKWIEHKIGPARHSGAALGDIDGDGDPDVVRADWWFENVDGKGQVWEVHANIPFAGKKYNAFGMATQTRLADLDSDGDLDVVVTDGEVKDARAAWIENEDGKGRRWQLHSLTPDGKGALHSLALADFDNDGDIDVFSCEMEIGGSGRWFIWENPGRARARSQPWREHTILKNVPGHESRVGDVDGDGDIPKTSKLQNAKDDEQDDRWSFPVPH